MPSTYLLARDHLQRAAAILDGSDSRTQQLRHIIERTVSLINDVQPMPEPAGGNVLDLASFRYRTGRN